mmetsp:Transcript_7584/g.16522  ORF Transcript_7584/g.16522 Transcript_7584/m.16522 type:complete len:205 (-) Transcript_7584:579-1193(-)
MNDPTPPPDSLQHLVLHVPLRNTGNVRPHVFGAGRQRVCRKRVRAARDVHFEVSARATRKLHRSSFAKVSTIRPPTTPTLDEPRNHGIPSSAVEYLRPWSIPGKVPAKCVVQLFLLASKEELRLPSYVAHRILEFAARPIHAPRDPIAQEMCLRRIPIGSGRHGRPASRTGRGPGPGGDGQSPHVNGCGGWRAALRGAKARAVE